MFDVNTGRQSAGRFADLLRGRLHRQHRTVTEDEQFEVYTDLATLLRAADDSARDAAMS